MMEQQQQEHQQSPTRLQPLIDFPSLEKFFSAVDVTVSPLETQPDANHRRWKDKILFLFAVGGLALLFLICLGILTFGSQSLEEKKIWMGVLASLISAMIGFAIGKKT